MIKKIVEGFTFTFKDGTSEEEQMIAIEQHLERQHYFRQIIIRKSDGSEIHLGNGVRKHGKRHTS